MVSLFDLGEFWSNFFLIIYLLLAEQLRLRGLVVPQHVGNFLDQALTPRLLHWQAESLSLSHQGSPRNNWECTLHGGIFCLFDELEISYIWSPTFLFLLLWSHRKHKMEPNPKFGLDTGTDDMLWECLLIDEAFQLEHYRLPTWWESLSLPRQAA